ncbi:hypothetical protein ACIQ7Q_22230 [Streptomyces sp. NPDC096176]|uniref:hypothetical protein n=1 Tax=Streptomyces sp. NPDC096176 TaxID=3366079 RepID=UPI00381134CB
MADEDPSTATSDGGRGFGCMILMIFALIVAMLFVLALPYLPALVDRTLIGREEPEN